MDFEEALNRKFVPQQAIFTRHFEDRAEERKIKKDSVLELLASDKLIYAEYQKVTDTYKLVYPLSNTYMMIVIIALDKEAIRIVTVMKSNKKIKKFQEKRGASASSIRRKF